ncbi:MAG: DUF2125 domain-containing protein [Janthinobacterium lividum]
MDKVSVRRRLRLAAIAAVSCVIAADTVIWAIACRRLDDGARDAAAAAGWSLSAEPARWRGWPFAAEIVLPNATLRSGPDIIPPLAWTAGTQTLRLGAIHPSRLTISAAGPQSIALGDAPPLAFTAGSLIATLDLRQADPAIVSATDLDIAAPAGPVRIASARLDTRPDSLAMQLSTVSLPGSDGQPIQPPIDSLHVVARLSTPVVPMATAAASAQRWRADGGHLDIDDAALAWGPLAVTGAATLALDPALQPALTGRLAATGLFAGLDRLVATGALTASGALAARGMLTVLAAPSGTGPVELPITVQNGTVSLARIPVLRLAPLRWD